MTVVVIIPLRAKRASIESVFCAFCQRGCTFNALYRLRRSPTAVVYTARMLSGVVVS